MHSRDVNKGYTIKSERSKRRKQHSLASAAKGRFGKGIEYAIQGRVKLIETGNCMNSYTPDDGADKMGNWRELKQAG
jgi:hypothetical protein